VHATSVIDIIRKTRDGVQLSPAEIEQIISGYVAGDVPESQIAAWLMAVVLRGLSSTETALLTSAMLHSGNQLDLSSFRSKKVDKHSTGAVGFKTSLVVAPIVAAAGLIVPMISGRSLGFTIGTLDKLESIAGLRVDLSVQEIEVALSKCGCVIVGANDEIVPADRKLFALRDLTGTVESAPLICASILSKKMAESIDGLVLEVVGGSGALMKSEKDAVSLAELMVQVGTELGVYTIAVVVAANEPLGKSIGSALEVKEAISTLKGEGPDDVRHLCIELAAWMFVAARVVETVAAGRELAETVLDGGKALATFREMVAAQGGDVRIVDEPDCLPRSTHQTSFSSAADGYVTSIASDRIGQAARILHVNATGATAGTKPDPAAGIVLNKKVGDHVAVGEPLYTIHWNSQDSLSYAQRVLSESYSVGNTPPAPSPALVLSVVR
jgi:pyrimidine-nucleoside phosphorylase